MNEPRNPHNVPHQSDIRSERKSPTQGSQYVYPGQSSDLASQGTVTRNSPYGHSNLQHMDDISSYDSDHQQKVVTPNPKDIHRQKPYEQNYTSTSGAKSLHSIEDACQYVMQMGNIWKVPRLPNGNEFLGALVDVIQKGQSEYVTEHSLTNERGETTYVMVVVRATSAHQREVLHSFQQLADPYIFSMQGRSAEASQPQPVEWFRCKAQETLRIHTKAIRSFNMSNYESSPQISQTRSKKPINHN